MKKRILLLVTLLFAAFLVLISCDVGDGTGDGSKSDASAVLGSGVNTYLVRSVADTDSEYISLLQELRVAAQTKTGTSLTLVDDLYQKCEHEIVLGNTSREISAAAMSRLNNMLKKEARETANEEAALADLIGYTVYSDGSSVAIVWSNDMLREDAINYFIDNYMQGSSLTLKSGYSKTATLSYSAHLDKLDGEINEAAWAELSAELADEPNGEQIVSAMKKLYSLYTDDMVMWLANLYDPVVGGWYNSNSARDNDGFLPDIGSTWGALSFMSSTGMVDNWQAAMPDWLKQQVGAFILSCQDEDGYFYHTQWGKGITSDKREEHLRAAKSMLTACGLEPKYPYPGTERATPSSAHVSRLNGRSTAVLVSSVVSVNAGLEQYESAAAFRAWLDGWYEDIKIGKSTFYAFGDELQSQVNNIKMYGQSLGVDLFKITTDFLALHQNSNGLWDNKGTYTDTNALHKITDVYNAAKTEIPNGDKIIETGIKMLSADTPLSASVDLYNAWSCIPYVLENIRNYAKGDAAAREAKVAAVIAEMRVLAPAAIISAAEKIAVFRKDDGSFSYGPKYSNDGGSGSPMAVPNTVEGDINGNAICMTSLVHCIYPALGLDTFVPIFNEIDYIRFISTLEGLGKIEKNPLSSESVIIDFQDCELGDDIPAELNASNNYGMLLIAEENRIIDESGTKNKYLEYTSGTGLVAPQNHPAMDINANKLSASPNYAVIEMDLDYVEGLGSVGSSLMLYGVNNIIMQFNISTNSGVVKIENNSDAGNVLAAVPFGQMFTLRIEYFWNEGYAAVYINDKLTGVTEKYYNSATKVGEHNEFAYLHFGASRAQEGVTRLDNIRVEKLSKLSSTAKPDFITKETGSSVTFENDDLYPEGELTHIGYGDIQLKEYGNFISGTMSIVKAENGNKYLRISNTPTATQRLQMYPYTEEETEANTTVMEMRLNADCETAGRNFLTFYWRCSGTSNNIINTALQVVEGGDGNSYILVKDASLTNAVTWPTNIKAGNDFLLRIEYYWSVGALKIFVNEICIASTESPSTLIAENGVERVFIYNEGGVSSTVNIDGIRFENINSTYTPEALGDTGGGDIVNSTVDFESDNDYPEGEPQSGFVLGPVKLQTYGDKREGQLNVEKAENGNKYLTLINGKECAGTQSLQMYPVMATTSAANTTVMETKLNVTGTVYDSGLIFFYWRPNGGSNTLESSLRLTENENGDTVVALKTPGGIYVTDIAPGADFVLRIEYYWSAGVAKFYIDNTCVDTVTDALVCASGIQRMFLYSDSKSYPNTGDSSAVSFDYITFKDVTVTDLELPTYSFTFIVDGTEYHSVSGELHSSVALPTPPEKTGYEFAGWYYDDGVWENPVGDSAVILGRNTEVYARFDEIIPEYTVTFIVDGQVHSTLTVKANAVITLPAAPEIEGMVFAGWYFDNGTWAEKLTETTLTGKPLTADVSVYARYLTEYTVTFVVEGVEYHSIASAGGEALRLPAAPKMEGYSFDGWYFDEGVWSERLTANSFADEYLTDNLVVYARFVEISDETVDKSDLHNDDWITP